ncbi:MAG: TolC family protein, partial [Deltaproteobacteria bacterium]|nr:TolC family protein [Deltaproteobacteria bacterium]
EARKVEELGLAGIHYLMGTGEGDVEDSPLLPVAFELPTLQQARLLASRRPERRAAAAGAEAAANLTELEWARWWPDFVLAGEGRFARSTSVDHPANAFMSDPYNATGGAIGVLLRWAPEPFVRGPKIDRAEAEEARARATLDMAREGLAAEAEKVWSEVRDARDRMKAAKEGERHSKAWMASVMQSEAAGLIEPRDLADALLQYFMMRARHIQATFDWNVGVMALQRATGQLPGAVRFVEEE